LIDLFRTPKGESFIFGNTRKAVKDNSGVKQKLQRKLNWWENVRIGVNEELWVRLDKK
jgi:hypothetical protein